MHINKNYNTLLKKVLKEGAFYEDPNRKGVKRLEVPSYTFRHEFKDGFPAISTKKLAWKSVVTELLWFLRGDTNIKYLVDNGCNIWNKDAYNYYLKISKQVEDKELSFDEFLKNIGNYPKYSKDYKYGDLGKVYGFYWKDFGSENINFKIQNKPILDSKYKPTYLGIANGKGKENNLLAKTWEGLIARCYDKNNSSYPYYGAKGVSVCDKWLSFEGFLEDAVLLPGYNNKLKFPNAYFLDKDGLGDGFTYDLNSCQWITASENSILRTNIEYIVEKNNIQYSFKNIAEFCKEHNIDNRNFSDLWTKQAKTRYGFKLIKTINHNQGVDQIAELIHDMINKPMSSELLVVARDPSHKDEQALPCCHYGFQIVMKPLSIHKRKEFASSILGALPKLATAKDYAQFLNDNNISKYGFELHWQQRSVDTFLG